MLRHMTTPSVTTRTGSQKPSIARRPSPWAYSHLKVETQSQPEHDYGSEGEPIRLERVYNHDRPVEAQGWREADKPYCALSTPIGR
ncbi:hypothetical protein B5K05_23460 [Rhizobium phaseoli]|nr:hypothetical protein B5K04_23395 [Rhizobium phaseoli]RDJ07253.1 hypothetical protein B5K05_23460 [Rhizobium phaseoli]